MKKIEEQKMDALAIYKEAKKAYLTESSNENWINFCNAKKACMMLGVRI